MKRRDGCPARPHTSAAPRPHLDCISALHLGACISADLGWISAGSRLDLGWISPRVRPPSWRRERPAPPPAARSTCRSPSSRTSPGSRRRAAPPLCRAHRLSSSRAATRSPSGTLPAVLRSSATPASHARLRRPSSTRDRHAAPSAYERSRSLSCGGARPPTARAKVAPSAMSCMSPYSIPLCTILT